MGKYINMSKVPVGATLESGKYKKKLSNVLITVISLIAGVVVLGVSWAFFKEINHTESSHGSGSGNTESSSSDSHSRETVNSQVFVSVIIIGGAVVLQLITSIAFWYWKEKEPRKSLIFAFAVGQGIIQIVLLICLGLIVYQVLKPSLKGSDHDILGKPGPEEVSETVGKLNNSTGHGFWLILSGNIIFHIAAISYLLHLVMKGSDEEQMEEMTAVVIHRRVNSRIPSERTKRHGRMQK